MGGAEVDTLCACAPLSRQRLSTIADTAHAHKVFLPSETNHACYVYCPGTNPDVVPRFVNRDLEVVNPLCLSSCGVDPVNDPGDNSVFTSGMCRKEAPQGGAGLCQAATPVHHIAWANPAVSGIEHVEKGKITTGWGL